MKKNWVLRLGLLAMVLTLVTMPMVSSTYAKYVTTANGTAVARVAKWGVDFTVNATNLFGDAYEDGVNSIQTAWSSAPDATTATVNALTDDAKILAPGTRGYVDLVLIGQSEVALAVSMTGDITRTGWTVSAADYDPINWTVTNPVGDYLSYTPVVGTTPASVSWVEGPITLKYDVLEAALALVSDTYNANFDFDGTEVTPVVTKYTIGWEWPYFVNTDSDVKDTALGTAGTATLKIDFTITATQID